MSPWLSAQVRQFAHSCGDAVVDCELKTSFLQDKNHSAAQRDQGRLRTAVAALQQQRHALIEVVANGALGQAVQRAELLAAGAVARVLRLFRLRHWRTISTASWASASGRFCEKKKVRSC